MEKILKVLFSAILVLSMAMPYAGVAHAENNKTMPEAKQYYIGLSSDGKSQIKVNPQEKRILNLQVERQDNIKNTTVVLPLKEGISYEKGKTEMITYNEKSNQLIIDFKDSAKVNIPLKIDASKLKNTKNLVTAKIKINDENYDSNHFVIEKQVVNQAVQQTEATLKAVMTAPRSDAIHEEDTAHNAVPDNDEVDPASIAETNKTTSPEVRCVTKPKISNEATVSNWKAFTAAMQDNAVNIIHVKASFNNDEGNDDANTLRTIPMRPIKINGNGNSIDFRGITFTNNTALKANEIITWEVNNLKIYGSNMNGPLQPEGSTAASGARGSIIFDGVMYTGSQMVSTDNWRVEFKGNIQSYSQNYYKFPYDGLLHSAQGNQLNIKASNIIFRKGSYYYGVSDNAGVIKLTNKGQIIVEENASITLRSDGSSGENGDYALYVDGKLKTEKNAKLTINSSKYGKQYGIYIAGNGNGIEADNGSTITVNSYGNTKPSVYLADYTTLDVKNEASMYLNSLQREDSVDSVIELGTYVNFKVSNSGTFSAISDSYNKEHYILKGQVNTLIDVNQAKYFNLQFTNSRIQNSAKLINIASGTLYADAQNVQAWTRKSIELNDRAPDLNWTPMYEMQTQFSKTGPSLTTNGTSPNSAVAKNYLANFNLDNYSRLVYAPVDDFDLAITNTPNDNVDDADSRVIKGTTIPGAYVRVTGDDALPDSQINANIQGSTNPEITDKYTVIADSNGNFIVNTKPDTTFTSSNSLKIFAYKDGKKAVKSIQILDKTAPTAEGITLTIAKGDPIPAAREFMIKIKDTNPKNLSITHTYLEDYTKLSNEVGLHDVVMQIYDAADNKRNIPAKLNVVEEGFGIEVNDINVNLSDLRKNTTDAQIIKYLIKESKATAWGIENYNLVDYTDKLTVLNIPSIRQMKPGKYTMTASFDLSATNPKAKAIKYFVVTVLNDEAVPPTNPEKPGSGSPSEQENVGTGQTGLLKLDYAPSTFDFGTVKYGFTAKDTNALKTQSSKQWLQVSDNRAGENMTNWSVQVTENHPLQSAKGDELTGATIRVPQGKLYNQKTGSTALQSDKSALTSNGVDITSSPSVIFKANQTKGKMQDISTDVWEATDVKLHLPENKKYEKVDYSNTITWTLVAEP